MLARALKDKQVLTTEDHDPDEFVYARAFDSNVLLARFHTRRTKAPSCRQRHAMNNRLSVNFKTNRLREFSLVFVKAVKVVDTQFECRSDVQNVGRARAKLGRSLAGQLPSTLEDWIGQSSKVEEAVPQILLKIS